MRPIFMMTLIVFAIAGCRSSQRDPEAIAPHAIPSDTGRYVGYQVGGGCARPHKAEPGGADEGTWGWDYRGWLPRRVELGWWHGRREQGGGGAYETDGPHYRAE